ncbi:hypothetical protein [Paenibacillus kandeliae]|uniref:hypothetical protein n=1 Tax=Paenibacillus kandeliae TaxID=3231269 RepID=UPI00345AFE7D
MSESFAFPVFSGILQPKHQKKIGNAIWLFLWCISCTTKEEVVDGVVWGVVLGGKPISTSRLATEFETTAKTVSRWIDILEKGGYIQTTRAPYGLIYKVHNSKKYVWTSRKDKKIIEDKNVQSDNRDQTFLSARSDINVLSDPERTDKNVQSNKDILNTIITTTDDDLFSKHPKSIQQTPLIELINAYCQLHNKLDFHVTAKERELMGKMVSGDIPLSFTIPTMKALYEDKRRREGEEFQQPSSFVYYVHALQKAWNNQQPKIESGNTQPLSKQQASIDALQRMLQEAQDYE